MSKVTLETIVALCKRRGFIYPGSEIYGGLAGTWDYGPLGVALKRNIVNLWWKTFVETRADILGIDTTILMNPKVWQASGHLDTFNDPLVECSKCKMRFREDKIDKTKCPNCGQEKTFGKPRLFNLMFKTNVGPLDSEQYLAYLRPETAQGMFTNYKNILDSFYPDLPFGVAQVGRNFRNEISPRDFIFRSREFEIMELEYFLDPKDWEKYFEEWQTFSQKWFDLLGLAKDKLKEVEVPEKDRAHYSKRTIDFYYDFPSLGFDEIGGLAYRTDYDLKNIERGSGKSMEYRPKQGGKPFVPHVIEPTYGLDRNVLAVISDAYREDQINNEPRNYLKLATYLAPVKVAVFPLLRNRPDLVKKAHEIYKELSRDMMCEFDANGNIGKRYRRQDEIGTPICITVDFNTIKDDTVTIRDRDTAKQKRVNINNLLDEIKTSL